MSTQAFVGAPSPIAPGWYSDPLGAHQARWWDGDEWTRHVQALPMGEPPEEEWVETSRLVPAGKSWANRSLGWGIVALVANALLAPTVLAFVFGVMALRRDDRLRAQGYELTGRRRAVLGIAFGAVGIVIEFGWLLVLRMLTHPGT
jgi:hypothetical protein